MIVFVYLFTCTIKIAAAVATPVSPPLPLLMTLVLFLVLFSRTPTQSFLSPVVCTSFCLVFSSSSFSSLSLRLTPTLPLTAHSSLPLISSLFSLLSSSLELSSLSEGALAFYPFAFFFFFTSSEGDLPLSFLSSSFFPHELSWEQWPVEF